MYHQSKGGTIRAKVGVPLEPLGGSKRKNAGFIGLLTDTLDLKCSCEHMFREHIIHFSVCVPDWRFFLFFFLVGANGDGPGVHLLDPPLHSVVVTIIWMDLEGRV